MTDTSTISTNHVVSAKKRVTFGGLIGKLIDAIFKAVLLVLVIVILTPIVYFAWRAGQPMDLPEFQGLTYYQVLSDRHAALYNKALAYQKAHPGERIWLNQCFTSEAFMHTGALIPVGYITLSNMIDPHNSYYRTPYGPANGWLDYLPTWWKNYEDLLIGDYKYIMLESYCNIAPPIGP